MITRRIESRKKRSKRRLEARKHCSIRHVMNKQRQAVYACGRNLLEGLDQKDLILEDYVSGILGDLIDQYAPLKEMSTIGT